MNGVPEDWLVRAAEHDVNFDLERDNVSFEDSERFEEDSECSFFSSEESISQNWRGWAHGAHGDPLQSNSSMLMPHPCPSGRYSSASSTTVVGLNRSSCSDHKGLTAPVSLAELASKTCARTLSFEQLELYWREIMSRKQELAHDVLIPSYCIPENLILSIIQWCFPSSMDDIRLYCCLANGNGDEFNYGEAIYHCGAVSNVIQIGFLITAKVNSIPRSEGPHPVPFDRLPQKDYDVALQLDRGHVINCKCTCGTRSSWCLHVVAVCHYRLYQSSSVEYRKPIWDSISELSHDNLKKMVQFFINMIPWEYLSTAQKLLDELKASHSEISTSLGVPDPTDGGHDIVARWAFNDQDIHIKIRKLLQSFCVPTPVVYSDVGAMTSPIHSQHPVAQEWRTLRKCMKAREPEGLWNLVSIVREMFTRRDANAICVLRIITEECLANSQILLWWYVTKLIHSNEWVQLGPGKNECYLSSYQLNASLLCDELVALWRIAALNPLLPDDHKSQLFVFLQNYHRTAANRIWTVIKNANQEGVNLSLAAQLINSIAKKGQTEVRLNAENAKFSMQEFPGFHAALHTCWTFPKMSVFRKESSHLHYSVISQWDSSSCVPLQPCPAPAAAFRKKKRKPTRHPLRFGRRRDPNPRIVLPEEESSESGQESEQDGARARAYSPLRFPQEELDGVLAAAYLAMEALEVRYARCEAMFAHGFGVEAVHIARDLSKTLKQHMPGSPEVPLALADQPGCSHDTDGDSIILKDYKVNIEKSLQSLDCMEKALQIAQILRAQNDSSVFSFVLGILLSPKQPMATKFHQFKEYHIECELIEILKQISIGDVELERLRKTAHYLCHLNERPTPLIVPHIALSHFVFEKLSYTINVCELDQAGHPRVREPRDPRSAGRLPSDDDLCLQVALDALGTKLLVPEEDFQMLSEIVRRLKGELCIDLLIMYKDSREKVGLLLDKFLDPHVHKMYSDHLSNAAYFMRRDPVLIKNVKNGQRPVFPYKVDEESSKEEIVEEEEEELRDDLVSSSSNSKVSIKRWRLKKLEYPTEAQAQYMTELSKRIVEEAGGNQNPVVFAAPLGANVVQGPHRNLRMCGILIALYGLGLHNRVSASWHTRTYNGNTSWINGQSIEIGSSAVELIREVWVGHYTAAEAASLADKASSESRDPAMIKEAAELALSVLPYAHNLSCSEILKALLQCREQGSKMLEKGCEILKNVYTKTLLPTEALWKIARYWEELHIEFEQPLPTPPAQSVPQPVNAPLQGPLPPPPHPQMGMHFGGMPSQNMYRYPHGQPYSMGPMPQGHPHFPPGNMPNVPYMSNYGMYNPVNMPANVMGGPPMPLIQAPPAPGLHQSHSAPQLSAPPPPIPHDPENRLVFAHQAGIRALESMGITSQNEDSRTKYAVTSVFTPDIQWLYAISAKLGAFYFSTFLETAARHLSSPYALYNLALHSITLAKPLLLQTLIYGMIPQSNASKQVYQVAGQVRTAMLHHSYHPVTAELFERAVEQFYVGVTTKLNFSRFSLNDRDEAQKLLQTSYDALQYVPQIGRNIFEDLCRQAKKQKAGKRDLAHFINELSKRNPNIPHNSNYN